MQSSNIQTKEAESWKPRMKGLQLLEDLKFLAYPYGNTFTLAVETLIYSFFLIAEFSCKLFIIRLLIVELACIWHPLEPLS